MLGIFNCWMQVDTFGLEEGLKVGDGCVFGVDRQNSDGNELLDNVQQNVKGTRYNLHHVKVQ